MTPWLAAVIGLIPPLLVPGWVAMRGRTADRLIAVQLATSITSFTLVLMSFAFDQSPEVDLALTLALLSLPGTLGFAMFLERWL